MIVLLTRLLQADTKLAGALTKLVNAIVAGFVVVAGMTDANLEALKKWWQSARQEQVQSQPLPLLSKEAEALFLHVQQLLETQQQIDALKRYVLTLPALPDEGY
jgi:hypothetical protein